MFRRTVRTITRPIRRTVRRVQYNSATREYTAWTAARDWSIVAALVLAVPAVLLSEVFVERDTVTETIEAELFDSGGGTVRCVMPDAEGNWHTSSIEEPPLGETLLHVQQGERGWPWATWRTSSRVRLDLNLYDEANRRLDAQLAADSPVRASLEAALVAAGHDRVASLWNDSEPRDSRRLWIASVVATAVWWLMLVAAAWLMLVLARAGAIILYAHGLDRDTARLVQGRCAVCDYDLRGLEYSVRCPECGTLLE